MSEELRMKGEDLCEYKEIMILIVFFFVITIEVFLPLA